jgi:hypothetical protein
VYFSPPNEITLAGRYASLKTSKKINIFIAMANTQNPAMCFDPSVLEYM